MKAEVNTPLAVALIVVVVLVAGFFLWRSQQQRNVAPVSVGGVPLVPTEARPGADAMSKLWQSGVQPPKKQ
ncbi:MAG: hypothetical protein IT208_03600 [Chthonomonadales bacterium]|nr:hypothetical protein [Chthonomonadales bacterium]